MLDWLSGMNRCSVNEEETTRAIYEMFRLPVLDAQKGTPLTSDVMGINFASNQDLNKNMGSCSPQALPLSSGEKKKHGIKKPSFPRNKDGPAQTLDSEKKLIPSSDSRRLNDVNGTSLEKEADVRRLSKCHDLEAEKHSHKHKIHERHSSGGDGNQLKSSRKRETEPDYLKASKKVETEGVSHAKEDWRSNDGSFTRKVGHSSSSGSPAFVGKNQQSDDQTSLKVSKSNTAEKIQVSAKYLRDKVRDSSDSGCFKAGNSNEGELATKKRKKRDIHGFQTGSESLPSMDYEHNNSELPVREIDHKKEKKPRTSKSEGKESDLCKGSSRSDKGGSRMRNQQLEDDLAGVDTDPVKKKAKSSQPVAATSSSSRVCGSRKSRGSLQYTRGSPAESVSSSLIRSSKPGKLTPVTRKLKEKYDSQGASSSPDLPFSETNLPSQSAMSPDISQYAPHPPYTVDSYTEPQNFSHVVSQLDFTLEDWLDGPLGVNAEGEVSNSKVPQGTFSRDHGKKINYRIFDRKVEYAFEGRIDNIRSNGDELMKLNSLPDGGTGWRKFGKIRVSRKEIAKGSNGTIVLEGIYEDRPVAVKRLVRAHCDVASNEIQILMSSDRHKNIVCYHGVEYDPDFVYLALERCACSLDDLIQAHSDSSNNSAFRGGPASTDDYKIKLDSVRGMMQDVNLWRADGYPSPLLQKLMRNVVSGLSHLHDLRIIHRDLKPQNVLITKNQPFCAQLSDMGISKPLPEDKSSLGYHAGCGTSGWRAPELLLHGGRQTQAMDVFSLGCVLCFFFTRGRHPFGENLERDYNIVCNKMDLSFVDIPEAHDLFSCLLNQDPKLRPKASEVLHHPFFWSSKTRLSFLSDVSNKVEFETGAGNLDLLNALESTAQSIFVGNWEDKIEPAVRTELWRRRHYDGSLVRHLLIAVRNVYSHHMEFPEEVKEILGPVDDGLDAYFAIRFPRLLIESYRVVSQICIRKELLAGVLSN